VAVPVALDIFEKFRVDDFGAAEVEESLEADSQSGDGAEEYRVHDDSSAPEKAEDRPALITARWDRFLLGQSRQHPGCEY
jgi:hypothetical protein